MADGFEIVHATKLDYHGARSLFERHPKLSFADATILSYVRREEMTSLYSFDGIEGIERLNVAESPYA